MNTKALIFSISLVLITLGALVSLFIIISKLEKQADPLRNIGERSLEIINTAKQAEQIQFFIDTAAPIAAEKAIKKFKENTGLTKIECGTLQLSNQQYIFWNDNEKKCFQTNFYDNYETYFNKELDKYLNLLTSITHQNIHTNNYHLFIDDTKTLSGIAIQPIQLNILSLKQQNIEGIYTFKPSFTIPFEQDLRIFNKLKKFANKALLCSESKNQEDKETCIEAAISSQDFTILSTKHNNDIFLFDIPEPLTLQFMLNIPLK